MRGETTGKQEIGKRNISLNEKAIKAEKKIKTVESKAAR